MNDLMHKLTDLGPVTFTKHKNGRLTFYKVQLEVEGSTITSSECPNPHRALVELDEALKMVALVENAEERDDPEKA